MDFTIIIKIVAVALVIAFLNQLLQKAGKEEYTLLLTIAGLLICFPKSIMYSLTRKLTSIPMTAITAANVLGTVINAGFNIFSTAPYSERTNRPHLYSSYSLPKFYSALSPS
jgi:hypothetical protein